MTHCDGGLADTHRNFLRLAESLRRELFHLGGEGRGKQHIPEKEAPVIASITSHFGNIPALLALIAKKMLEVPINNVARSSPAKNPLIPIVASGVIISFDCPPMSIIAQVNPNANVNAVNANILPDMLKQIPAMPETLSFGSIL